MFPQVSDLMSALSIRLRGVDHDPFDHSEDTLLVEHLGQLMNDAFLGDVSEEEVLKEFSRHDLKGFDVQAWINENT